MAAKNLLAMLILIATSFAPRGFGEAAGPWKAQVVDAETGKPLEGVVVLAYWIKYARTVAGKADAQFYDAEEVVTGPDGHFVIQERSTWTLNPFRTISGAQFVMFKPGYGRWRFKGEDVWLKLDTYERNKKYKEAWEQFTGDGVVIELPPLKTWKERREFYGTLSWAPVVPPEKTKRLREAEDVERVYLGFGKMHEVKP